MKTSLWDSLLPPTKYENEKDLVSKNAEKVVHAFVTCRPLGEFCERIKMLWLVQMCFTHCRVGRDITQGGTILSNGQHSEFRF